MKFSFALVLFCIVVEGFCQSTYNDSIVYLLNDSQSPQEKVTILNRASAAMADADLKKCFDYATRAFSLSKSSNFREGMADAHINLGKYFSRLGQHETAMENFQEALKISQQLSDERRTGLIYKIMGNGYFFQDDFTRALQYYKLALSINQKLNDEETSADLNNNIGLIFINLKKLDSAEIFINESIGTYQKLGREGKLANAYLNLGYLKERVGKYEEAIAYFNKALVINQANALKLQEATALNNIASSLLFLGRYPEAGSYITKALAIVKEQRFRPQWVYVLENQYRLHKLTRNLSAALDDHEAMMALKDSLINENKNKQIEELRVRYESDRKERENEMLLSQSELQENELLLQRTLIFFIAFFAIVVSMLAFFYYQAMKKNKKANDELMRLNLQINQQKKEIIAQADKLTLVNREVSEINENLEAMVKSKVSRIVEQNQKLAAYSYHNSHLVRAPLARILGLTDLIQRRAIAENELNSVLSQIKDEARELDVMINNINLILQDNPGESKIN